jgi:hypothetical protein
MALCDNQWHINIYPFCEGRLFSDPGHWEPTSTISAIVFIFGLSTYLAITSDHRDRLLRVINLFIMTNGPHSASYHATKYNFWGTTDVTSMFIASVLSNYVVIDQALHNTLVVDRRCNTAYHYATTGIGFIIFYLYSVAVSAMTSTDIHTDVSVYFVISQGIVAASLLFLWYAYSDEDSDDWKMIKRYLWVGAVTSAVSGGMWAIYEPLCRDHTILAYIPIHAVWHFGSTYGYFLMLNALIFCDNYDSGFEPYLLTHNNKWIQKWLYVFPIVKIKK